MKTDYDRIIADKIFQFVDLNKKHVLEVGCGNGCITSFITGKPKELIAIDPDIECIREAQNKVTGAEFKTGYGEYLEFPDKSFDLILFTLSLHHQNCKRAIEESLRVIKNTGYILVIEPVNSGEVEQIFGLLHNEDKATLEAQKAIKESSLVLEREEIFYAKWTFKNKDDLYQSLFDYYDMSFDADITAEIAVKLGRKLKNQPIVLIDKMLIQLFRKVK